MKPFNRYFRIIVPLLLALGWYSLSFLFLPPKQVLILGGLVFTYFIPPSEKEWLIPVGIALGVPWWFMASTLAVIDVMTTLFTLLNFPLLVRVPHLGPWISQFLQSGQEFMKERPWLARWRILGLAFFVFLPFQGTGGVGAAIVGMILGLTFWEILLAVAIGATLEAFATAVGFEIIWNIIRANVFLGIAILSGVILLGALVYLRFRPKARKQQSA